MRRKKRRRRKKKMMNLYDLDIEETEVLAVHNTAPVTSPKAVTNDATDSETTAGVHCLTKCTQRELAELAPPSATSSRSMMTSSTVLSRKT